MSRRRPTVRQRSLAVAVVGLVAVVAVVAGPDGTVHACSCEPSTVADDAAFTVAAFVGTQIDRDVEDEFSELGAVLTFRVDRVMAGDVTQTYRVRTAAQGSACGIDLDGAGSVGVLAFGTPERPVVGLCGSQRSPDELVAFYGEGSDPLADPPDANTEASGSVARIALTALLVGVVGAGGVVAVRRRRG